MSEANTPSEESSEQREIHSQSNDGAQEQPRNADGTFGSGEDTDADTASRAEDSEQEQEQGEQPTGGEASQRAAQGGQREHRRQRKPHPQSTDGAQGQAQAQGQEQAQAQGQEQAQAQGQEQAQAGTQRDDSVFAPTFQLNPAAEIELKVLRNSGVSVEASVKRELQQQFRELLHERYTDLIEQVEAQQARQQQAQAQQQRQQPPQQ